jgi:hypothetical protein
LSVLSSQTASFSKFDSAPIVRFHRYGDDILE